MKPSRETLNEWRINPKKFAYDNFQFIPDKWQEKVLDAFPSMDKDKTQISMQACAGPGKSALLAVCVWNFMVCYGARGDHPKGAAISITAQNLKDNLWAEINKWRSRSKVIMNYFDWTQERIFCKDHPSTWFMSARGFSKKANVEEQGRTLSGLHAPFVLYVIDESGDIPIPVLRSAQQGLSNCRWGKIMQAGNPTSHDGMLYAAQSVQRDQWYIVRITGDPDDPERSPKIDIEYARSMIKQYGRHDPWVMAFILGQFPPSSINALLSPEEVEAAMGKHLSEDKYTHSQKRLGIDVARFGTASTVIFPRQGLAAFTPIEMRGARTPDIAARVMQSKAKWGSELEFIDDTGGFGGGVLDSLLQARSPGYAVNFASNAIDPRYYNKRSEMWFQMAEWVKRGGALPNHTRLQKELVTPTYTFQNGCFRLEEKDQIIKRLNMSPDFADALALTFALPEMPARNFQGIPINNNQVPFDDYNPYDSKRI